MAKHPSRILELARRGAEVRFGELMDELKLLTLSFPHLRDSVDRNDLPVKFLLRRGGETGARRTTRRLSAAARKAIGDAQRARWARQKAGTPK
ncbi:MAG: hypothetical protein ACRD3J_29155 [Thermoanaerobaculia bacterium]